MTHLVMSFTFSQEGIPPERKVVQEFLDQMRGKSVQEAASLLGVSHETVARWRRGEWKRLNSRTYDLLLKFFREGPAPEFHPEELGKESVLSLISHPNVIDTLLGIIGEPGENQSAKAEALEGYRMLITNVTALPPWWHDLSRRVAEGDL